MHAGVLAHRRLTHGGDFDISREFGRRFLAGEPLYAGGLHYPYMPTAAMYFAPLALVPPGVGIAVRYAVALVCLWLTMRMLARVVPLSTEPVRVTVAAVTLLLASHAILRDLDDGGPHLILLALLTGGVACARQGRDALAGMWFGLAAALKAPAALFLPFLLWKRQWRPAAYTAVALLAWTILPALWMGPSSWWRHQSEWMRVALASAVGAPIPGAAESESRVQNQALKPALVRYLAWLDGAPADASTWPPATANRVATLLLVGFLAACARWMRVPYRIAASPRWLLECAVVLLLVLLCSPVTWVQHMVLMIPALYLIVVEDRDRHRLGTPARGAMVAYVMFALVLNREVIGRQGSLILLGYQVHTWCVLVILGILVLRQPTVGSA